MKSFYIGIITLGALVTLVKPIESRVEIIPVPAKVEVSAGEFVFTDQTRIFSSKEFEHEAGVLADLFKVSKGFEYVSYPRLCAFS